MLSFTQGVASGIPCSAKENVMATDVIYLSTCNKIKPTSFLSIYCVPCLPPNTTSKSSPVCKWKKKCKGQLWILVVSYRRELFTDERLTNVSHMYPYVYVCCLHPSGLLNQLPLGEANLQPQSVHLLWAAQKETLKSQMHGKKDCAAWKSATVYQICMSKLQH